MLERNIFQISNSFLNESKKNVTRHSYYRLKQGANASLYNSSFTPLSAVRETLERLAPLPKTKNPQTPLPHNISNQTRIYTFQPPMRFHEQYGRSKRFYPEYVIREAPKECCKNIDDERRHVLFANLNIPLSGTLIQESNGHCYLSIPYAEYTQLTRLFHQKNFTTNYYHRDRGPFVSAILPRENPLGIVEGENKRFEMSIARAYIVENIDCDGIEAALIVTLNIPELEKLRSQHRLPETIDRRPFHLTLAVKTTDSHSAADEGFLRVHVGYHPV